MSGRYAGRRALVAATAAALAAGACAPGAARPEESGRAAAAEPELSASPVTTPGYHDETSVAADPIREGGVVAVWQVPATAGRSSDGGATWSSAPLPGTERWELAGDPSVIFSDDGTAHALFIAFDRPDDYRVLGRAAHRNGIFTSRSTDGGGSWTDPAAVVEHAEAPGIPFEDKPMMTADRRDASPHHGNLYVAWTQFRADASGIRFSRSTDGGRSWSEPTEISDRPGSPQDTVGAAEGTDLAVGPDGTLYVVWSDSTGLLLDRSKDGGRTFGRDVHVRRTSDIVFPVPGVARANGYPSLEVDPRSGRLFVTWVDRSAGEADVWLITSDDGGDTWTEPVRVSGDPAGSGREHFFAWSSVDPVTGTYVAGYYRVARPDSADPELRYTISWSGDGGRSFSREPWGAPFRPGGEFLGDYTGVDARAGVAYGAWTDVAADTASAAGEGPGVHGSRHHTRVVVGRAVFGPRSAGSGSGGRRH